MSETIEALLDGVVLRPIECFSTLLTRLRYRCPKTSIINKQFL